MDDKPLSQRQEAFVREYLVDYNATRAAARAGYSEKTVHVQGPRLLSNVSVNRAINKGIAAKAEKVTLTREMVIGGLTREANAGDLDVPNSARTRAQELLGKHLGLWTEKHQIENIGPAPVVHIVFGDEPCGTETTDEDEEDE